MYSKEMKNKKFLILILATAFLITLFVAPVILAAEQNLSYDSTKNTINIGYDKEDRITNKTGRD